MNKMTDALTNDIFIKLGVDGLRNLQEQKTQGEEK